jgi:hypothetical protein
MAYQPALLGRIRARYRVVRLPKPPVRPGRETFAASGSRARAVDRQRPWRQLPETFPVVSGRVRWVPWSRCPTLSLRAVAVRPRPGVPSLPGCRLLGPRGLPGGRRRGVGLALASCPPSCPSLPGSPVVTASASQQQAVGGGLRLAPCTLWGCPDPPWGRAGVPLASPAVCCRLVRLMSPRHPALSLCLADLASQVCQGGYAPEGAARFWRITLALLRPARPLGDWLSPHRAGQGPAAHPARWLAMLRPNGSSDTCISDGVFHIPMPCFHGAIPAYPGSCDIRTVRFHGAQARVDRAPRSRTDGQPWMRTRRGKRRSHATMPLAAVPTPGSSFRLLTMAYRSGILIGSD